MAVTTYLGSVLLSYLPFILPVVIVVLSIMLYQKRTSSSNCDPLSGFPEIKPHWFWGNMDFTRHIDAPMEEHYKRMKGLQYGLFYNFSSKQLCILDPDIANKVMNTDFDHFTDVPFLPVEYTKV